MGFVNSRIRKRAHVPSGMRRTAEGAMLTLTGSHAWTRAIHPGNHLRTGEGHGLTKNFTVTTADACPDFRSRPLSPPIRSADSASVIEDR